MDSQASNFKKQAVWIIGLGAAAIITVVGFSALFGGGSSASETVPEPVGGSGHPGGRDAEAQDSELSEEELAEKAESLRSWLWEYHGCDNETDYLRYDGDCIGQPEDPYVLLGLDCVPSPEPTDEWSPDQICTVEIAVDDDEFPDWEASYYEYSKRALQQSHSGHVEVSVTVYRFNGSEDVEDYAAHEVIGGLKSYPTL